MNTEIIIRLSFFLGVFAIIGYWEVRYPRRPLIIPKMRRWLNNLGLVILNTFIVRLIFPLAAVGLAASATENGWGLLNQYTLSTGWAIILSIIALDFIIYLQHVMFHAVPLLWRLHVVHHADQDYDVTTGLRFHPIEIILSMLIKFAAIVVLGPPVIAVIIFEVLLNVTAMFNHGNIQLPEKIDRILRLFVVTPDMHRVHHSTIKRETNSNYGFNLPWWDRLFGTYRDQPELGHEKMIIGLDQFQDTSPQNLPWLLVLPIICDPNYNQTPHQSSDTMTPPN